MTHALTGGGGGGRIWREDFVLPRMAVSGIYVYIFVPPQYTGEYMEDFTDPTEYSRQGDFKQTCMNQPWIHHIRKWSSMQFKTANDLVW